MQLIFKPPKLLIVMKHQNECKKTKQSYDTYIRYQLIQRTSIRWIIKSR